MSPALPAAASGIALLAGLIAAVEHRWRRSIEAELPSEIELGILSEADLRALRGWKRFRAGWLSDSKERVAFCRIAGKLARAKAAQRRASGERSRLLQVQVLTLRTRLRRLKQPARWTASGDGETATHTD